MIKPLDVEILIEGHVYTWNGKATFNVFENDHRFREKFNCDCFTMHDVTGWDKAMEAILDYHYTVHTIGIRRS